MNHGDLVSGFQAPVAFQDHPTRRYPNGRPVQVATMGEVEAHYCGFCGFPVRGDIAALDEHVARICPARPL